MAPTLHALRVFTTADGRFGNLLGVFLDGEAVPVAVRPGEDGTVAVGGRVALDSAAAYAPA